MAEVTQQGRRYVTDIARAKALPFADLVIAHAKALSALRAVWHSRSAHQEATAGMRAVVHRSRLREVVVKTVAAQSAHDLKVVTEERDQLRATVDRATALAANWESDRDLGTVAPRFVAEASASFAAALRRVLDGSPSQMGWQYGVEFIVPSVAPWVQPYDNEATARDGAARHLLAARLHANPDKATVVRRRRIVEPAWEPIPEEGTDG